MEQPRLNTICLFSALIFLLQWEDCHKLRNDLMQKWVMRGQGSYYIALVHVINAIKNVLNTLLTLIGAVKILGNRSDALCEC